MCKPKLKVTLFLIYLLFLLCWIFPNLSTTEKKSGLNTVKLPGDCQAWIGNTSLLSEVVYYDTGNLGLNTHSSTPFSFNKSSFLKCLFVIFKSMLSNQPLTNQPLWILSYPDLPTVWHYGESFNNFILKILLMLHIRSVMPHTYVLKLFSKIII